MWNNGGKEDDRLEVENNEGRMKGSEGKGWRVSLGEELRRENEG